MNISASKKTFLVAILLGYLVGPLVSETTPKSEASKVIQKEDMRCEVHDLPLTKKSGFMQDSTTSVDYVAYYVYYLIVAEDRGVSPHRNCGVSDSPSEGFSTPSVIHYCNACDKAFEEDLAEVKTLTREQQRAKALAVTEAWRISKEGEHVGAGQPATHPESKSDRGDKPQPEAEGPSR